MEIGCKWQMKSEEKHYLASMGSTFSIKNCWLISCQIRKLKIWKGNYSQAVGNKRLSYQYRAIGPILVILTNIGLTDDIPKFNLFDNDNIYTRPRLLPSKFQKHF
jgi:glucose-1-phosphate adenylyltransferase